jgi:hypothetical protein
MADPKDNKEEVKQNPQAEQKEELDEKDLDKASGGVLTNYLG